MVSRPALREKAISVILKDGRVVSFGLSLGVVDGGSRNVTTVDNARPHYYVIYIMSSPDLQPKL